ncbi:hypothetical protein GCM10007416_28250 [Kroppenstedtia guangzhouensis]|uniref:DUF1573 domain-containing protein n=1 Tax=Kroppenstedtia guangzhouensis TaxID=1274356 RepID=A0ABQ1H0C9_9BACL|nr:DUF1573 domain-containing protein [Kroppenstedtia guangzhouensis]GGA53488.1 hypothetical protein GCM10007416_28250 [Kroppenstedtia guangzhouensis]
METENLQTFQQQVADLLLRHRSVLDVSSKFQESNSRVNRALMKSVTECGCIRIQAARQPFTEGTPLEETNLDSHLSGLLCDHCLEVVKTEMGKNLFYLAAMCNLLEIRLDEVVKEESEKLSTLGVFNMR